jgi:hypothetical protein
MITDVSGMKLRRPANYLESQKDDSSMIKPQREAGKKTRKILHTEKRISNIMYLKMMTSHMQCDFTVVTSVRINVS